MHFQPTLRPIKSEVPYMDNYGQTILIENHQTMVGDNNNVYSHQPSHQRAPNKKMKQDYNDEHCSICYAKADGLHYGAISCRSCNAFFRRAVTFKQKFVCRKGGNCDLKSVRCACRACRYAKCIQSGMNPEAVQPKRDPTGAQKNRRPPRRRKGSRSPDLNSISMNEFSPTILPSVGIGSVGIGSVDSQTCLSFDRNSPDCCELTSVSPFISVCTPSPICPSSPVEMPTSEDYPTSVRVNALACDTFLDDTDEFEELVHSYREHLKMMTRATVSIKDFFTEQGKGPMMRMMLPTDVEKLSTTELSGFMYWIEKLAPFKNLNAKEKEIFFKMYSIRKLSLDHFYTASKFPELIKKGCFAMLNNTFVPPDRTGFETLMDDERTTKAKKDILRPTIDRLWDTIVLPFMKLGISDAEIVTLHILLLWSSNNNRHVSKETKEMMMKRREWAIERLLEHYEQINIPDHMVRLGEILLLLPEIECVCDMHCKDFQVAQLFEFCNMSEYWYEKVCYTNLNQT